MRAMDLQLERIVTEHATMVRRVGRLYRLRDADLDEVLQEVLIRLWRATDAREVSTSYVYRASMSAAIDILRRRRARRAERTVALDDVELPATDGADPLRSMEESELARQVGRAVDAIVPSRRAVVRMYLAGHSCEEVAATMGWSHAKTRSLLYRGLAELRGRLAETGISARRARAARPRPSAPGRS
jgi:RNA polymerase sigma factor (sigma-70 family)